MKYQVGDVVKVTRPAYVSDGYGHRQGDYGTVVRFDTGSPVVEVPGRVSTSPAWRKINAVVYNGHELELIAQRDPKNCGDPFQVGEFVQLDRDNFGFKAGDIAVVVGCVDGGVVVWVPGRHSTSCYAPCVHYPGAWVDKVSQKSCEVQQKINKTGVKTMENGSAVRIKELQGNGYGHKLGDIGIVTQLVMGHVFVEVPGRVSTSSHKPSVVYKSNQLELVARVCDVNGAPVVAEAPAPCKPQFKVGYVVRIKNGRAGYLSGDTAVVTEIVEDKERSIHVVAPNRVSQSIRYPAVSFAPEDLEALNPCEGQKAVEQYLKCDIPAAEERTAQLEAELAKAQAALHADAKNNESWTAIQEAIS